MWANDLLSKDYWFKVIASLLDADGSEVLNTNGNIYCFYDVFELGDQQIKKSQQEVFIALEVLLLRAC